jgi:hypothetical protein
MFEKKETYTPAEAKRAYDQLDHLIAQRTLDSTTVRIAGTSRAGFAFP